MGENVCTMLQRSCATVWILIALSSWSTFADMVPPSHSRPSLPHWAGEVAFTPGATLQTAVDDAVRKGSPLLEVQAGDYNFGPAAFTVANAHNLHIKGAGNGPSGSSLWFEPGYGVELLNCSNVTIEGFSSDTLNPAYSQGRVADVNVASDFIVVDVEDGFPLPTAEGSVLFNQTCPDGDPGFCGEIKIIYWDNSTRLMYQGQQMQAPLGNVNCQGRRCTAYARNPISWVPPVGALVTISPRGFASRFPIPTYYKGSTLIYNCTDTTLMHYDIHSAADMTFLENLGGGGNVYRDCNIRRRTWPAGAGSRYAPRLLASNSDGFHSMSAGLGPTLEDSELSFIADDFLNVHNRLMLLASIDPATSSAMIVDPGGVLGHDVHPGGDWSKHPRRITHAMDFLRPGDTIKLYTPRANTLDYTLVASLVVATVAEATGTPIPPLPQGQKSRIEPDAPSLWRVTFTSGGTVPALGPYAAVVQMDGLSSFGAKIQRNYFHDSYNNIARLPASDLVFRDNVVQRCADGIHVSYDIAGPFLEGSLGLTSISIVNNTFLGVVACPSDPDRGNHGCASVCSTIDCILDHVDPDLVGAVHAADNRVSPKN